MSYRNSLRRARDFISMQKGELASLPFSEEELNPEAQDDLTHHTYPLESTEACYKVHYKYPDDAEKTEFAFFEDGRQRTVQIGHIPTAYGVHESKLVIIPVHYFVVAAVILKRENNQLNLWGKPEIQEGILVAKSLVPEQSILNELENSGLTVVDTEALGQDYYDLRRRALQKAKDQRLEAENKLIAKWRTSEEAEDNFLIVDGTLMNFRDERNVDRCIGISKSFGSRYFSHTEQNLIMQMKEFERSWTFTYHSPEEDTHMGVRERVSWYLRLRKQHFTGPEFGLIRVEISKRYKDRAPEYAERFSHSLISERFPTSYPAPRWDKHLYPISECENYLSSIMPSIGTINASMKG